MCPSAEGVNRCTEIEKEKYKQTGMSETGVQNLYSSIDKQMHRTQIGK